VEALHALEQIFPALNVGFVMRQDQFDPQMVDALTQKHGVMKNSLFVGASEDMHNSSLEQLGDRRITF